MIGENITTLSPDNQDDVCQFNFGGKSVVSTDNLQDEFLKNVTTVSPKPRDIPFLAKVSTSGGFKSPTQPNFGQAGSSRVCTVVSSSSVVAGKYLFTLVCVNS